MPSRLPRGLKRPGELMDNQREGHDPNQQEVDEHDIKALFDRIADHFGEEGEESREFFSMLVRTALKYRDMLVHSSGEALTVGETRAALDVFMEVLKTHKVPEGLDKRVHDLVVLWLQELNERIHN